MGWSWSRGSLGVGGNGPLEARFLMNGISDSGSAMVGLERAARDGQAAARGVLERVVLLLLLELVGGEEKSRVWKFCPAKIQGEAR